MQEQGYDACGRTAWQKQGAERLAGSHQSVASWRPLGEHRYAWDKSGRLTGHEVWSRTRTERETRYQYDARDQITSVLRLDAGGPAQEERYRYTVNEQIAESRINGILSQHQYSRECVTQAGDSRYEYDACGRVTKRTEQKRGFRPQEWRYRWDDFDRLREIKTPDGEVWQYSYDAFGRRTAKRCVIRAAWKQQGHAISEMRYQWQGMALSISEKCYADGSPALREQWHYRDGFELLAKESRAANDDRSHFYPIVTGPDGVPQEMYSANGRKVWTKHRSLWGLAANDSPDSERESCDAGFMGQWQDEESGLWYNLHRYYDAGTGQYLSQDPLKLSGGMNTQSYVHDPVGWCDPWGFIGCPFKNQLPEHLDEELAAMREAGVEPMKPSDPRFADMADEAGDIKYVLLEDGTLLTAPKMQDGIEISHAAIANGKPVLAAGEATVVNGRFGTDIAPHSGHYHFGNTGTQNAASEAAARAAFEEYGVIFP